MTTEEEPTVRERLTKASQSGQEPKDRIWAMITALGILIFALGGLVIETRLFVAENRSLGYQRGAVDCLSLVVDNDRAFELPDYCRNDNLVVYYPESACELYFPENSLCGAGERGRR